MSLKEAEDYAKAVSNRYIKRISSGKRVKSSEGDDADNIMITDDRLSQMFGKGDFQKLNVIGQFNKGFILATLNEHRDLFILD